MPLWEYIHVGYGISIILLYIDISMLLIIHYIKKNGNPPCRPRELLDHFKQLPPQASATIGLEALGFRWKKLGFTQKLGEEFNHQNCKLMK
jgi:hypothetical protein